MKKMFATCLVVAHVLVGCGVSPVFTAEAPTRERTIGKSTSGQQRQVLPMDKVQKGTYLGKDDPARHGLVKQKPVGGASPAAAGTEAQPEDVGTPGFLKLVKGAAEVDVVPILTEAGDLDRLMFSPSEGALNWEVSAVEGNVAIKTVRLTIKSIAEYPAPIAPQSIATESLGAEPPLPTGDLVQQGGEPVTVDLETAALNWPVQLKSGSRSKLAFSLKGDAFRDFLAKSYGTARVNLKLQFLDAAGQPVSDEAGKAFTLEQTVDVM